MTDTNGVHGIENIWECVKKKGKKINIHLGPLRLYVDLCKLHNSLLLGLTDSDDVMKNCRAGCNGYKHIGFGVTLPLNGGSAEVWFEHVLHCCMCSACGLNLHNEHFCLTRVFKTKCDKKCFVCT